MDSLQTQIEWCQRIQRTLVVVLACCLAAFYLLGYRPATARLSAMNAQVETKRRELEAAQARARHLPFLVAYVDRLQAKLEKYKKLPRQPELGQFIKDITQVSQQAALRNFAVQPLGAKRMDLFYELPICMSFEGDFVSVASFLRQLEDLQRLTRVKRLNVKSKDTRQGQVEVDLAMNIFFSEG